LAELVGQSKLVSKLGDEIASLLGARLGEHVNVNMTGPLLYRLGKRGIGAVEAALVENADQVIRGTTHQPSSTVSRGISLGYLGYMLIAQLGSKAEALQALQEAEFPTNVIGGLDNTAGRILDAYRKSENA
jgi:hypothetical protein